MRSLVFAFNDVEDNKFPKSTLSPVVSILKRSILFVKEPGVVPPTKNPRVPPVCYSGDVESISHHASPLYISNLAESVLNLIEPDWIDMIMRTCREGHYNFVKLQRH